MNQPVTLANWRASPANHWAFHHVRELLDVRAHHLKESDASIAPKSGTDHVFPRPAGGRKKRGPSLISPLGS